MQDPNDIEIKKSSLQIKFNTKGLVSSIIRIAFDGYMGKLGGGTLPEITKTITFKSDKHRQAFSLVTSSLIGAFRLQIGEKIAQAEIDDNKDLVIYNRKLRFEIFEGLKDGVYDFNCDFIGNPQSFALLGDFIPLYRDWLKDTFTFSEERAEKFAADFRDYFAYSLLTLWIENKKGIYNGLQEWCEHSELENLALVVKRKKYKADIRKAYQNEALGEEGVALSDVYVEPNFLIFDQLKNEESTFDARQGIDKKAGAHHFIDSKFEGSIHDYFTQHFINATKSKAINQAQEEKRMLIILGQPGHGKSSFCHRCIYDVTQNADFNGNVFFIRLEEASRDIINDPLAEIEKMLPAELDFISWIAPKNKQKNILFLDGLDEFFMTQSLSDSEVSEFIENCKRLIQRRDNLYIVLTSRFNYVESNKLHDRDSLLFALDTLSRAQQNELVTKFKTQKKQTSCNLDAEIIAAIYENDDFQHVRELIALPILMQMILISNVDIKNAQSKSVIYDKLFEAVLKRKWDKNKRLKKYEAENKFKPQHLRRYLSYLAFKIFKSNKGYLHKSELENDDGTTAKFVSKYLRTTTGADLKDALRDILTSFYLKESRKDNKNQPKADESYEYAIEFLHKSLYEYLACEYLWQSTRDFFLEKDQDDDIELRTLEQVLTKVTQLFAHIRLTEESCGYLKEIIAADTDCHNDLAIETGKHFPKLLAHGFLAEYKREKGRKAPRFTPDQQVLNIFFGYYLILGELNMHKIDDDFYFNSKWSDFKAAIPWDVPAMTLAHEAEINEQIKKGFWSNEKKMITQLETDHPFFKDWLLPKTNTRSTLSDSQIHKFQYWIRRYAIKQKASLHLTPKIKSIEKVSTNFTLYLRLILAARLPIYLNLSFLNLSGQDLNYISARGINLGNANLSSTDLRFAYLRSANLDSADLSDANLDSANLRSTDLSNAGLDFANLRFTDLRDANLNNANLRSANLSKADLRSANLYNTDLRNANLSETDLRSTNLRDANLNNVDLHFANLSFANLSSTNLSSADLSSADLSHCKVQEINWIEKLSEWEVKGAAWVAEHYEVNPQKKRFKNRYGFEYEEEYEAYQIQKRK